MTTAYGAFVGLFAICFLLGSVPWGLVISKLFYHKDLRDEGSGNIGTTNALRTMGKKGGAAVFALDFGKGLLSGWLATVCAAALWAHGVGLAEVTGYTHEMIAAFDEAGIKTLCLGISFLGCVWGHIFSPWLRFKGGKGIAVAVGCLFFVFGPAGACLELAIFGVLVAATRYVSVGSIAAAAACPFLAWWYCGDVPLAAALVAAGALTVLWAHRGNIARLRAGTERKIGKGRA